MDLKNGEMTSEAEAKKGERGRDRLEEVSLWLRQTFPEASVVRSHGMNDIYRARGLFANPWTVALQASVHGIFQVIILE